MVMRQNNAFTYQYATSVGVGGADLFVIGGIQLLLQKVLFKGALFKLFMALGYLLFPQF